MNFSRSAQEAQRVAQRSLDQVNADKRVAALIPPGRDQWKQNAETFSRGDNQKSE